MTFAQQLSKDRERRLMTWTQYAQFLGLAESTVYGLLAGRAPSALTRAKVQTAQQRHVMDSGRPSWKGGK